jgi:Domain of unknown function (DUF4304)
METSPKKEMDKALAEIVIPVLRQLGFKGSFPHFRRFTNDRINLLTFQFDRYGGGFVIEIANAKLEDFTTSWGKKIEQKKLTAHNLYKRKRIQSTMDTPNSLTEDWFRYDSRESSAPNIYVRVCKDVLSKFPIVEEYWNNGDISS